MVSVCRESTRIFRSAVQPATSTPPRRARKPRKSQTKSPIYYPLKLTPPPPSNIFSLERICWDTGEEGRIHFYTLRQFKYMIACASYESQIVSKIKYFLFVITRSNDNLEIIIPLSQEKILLLRDNFLVIPTWFSRNFNLIFS